MAGKILGYFYYFKKLPKQNKTPKCSPNLVTLLRRRVCG
jgi:hypothetical protein